MASYHGELRSEFVPPFDTLKIDIHMSEPDYELGLDKERISSLEALQEDTFYSTENFVNMMGDLEAGRALQYVGRIIPIVHAPEDGADGHVHIEFYAKASGGPKVELRWTDAQGARHERSRDMWPLSGSMQPRLVAARARAGEDGLESLTWLLPADFKEDQHDEWVRVEGKEQVEKGIFSAEQVAGTTGMDRTDAYCRTLPGRACLSTLAAHVLRVRPSAAADGEGGFAGSPRVRVDRDRTPSVTAADDRGLRRPSKRTGAGAMGRAGEPCRERARPG